MSWKQYSFVAGAALGLLGCASGVDDGSANSGVTVAGVGGPAAGSGLGAGSGGMAPIGGTSAAGATSVAGTSGAAGMTAGASGAGAGGTTQAGGGAGMAGMQAVAGMGDDAGMVPSGPAEPQIPEVNGECPDFSAGYATVGNLTLTIDAGTPGDTKGSLLFAWHFTAGTAGAAMAGVPSSVRSEITAGGGLVIAPQGNVGGADRTDIAPPTGAWYEQDLEVADQIVACAVKNHNIDPNRIYSTGCSAGGLMSGTFGLMRSEYVAAIAPNSGGINFMASRKLSNTAHAPAAFLMHGGTGDNVIVNFADTSHWFEEQNRLASNMPFMIECNHGLGHCGTPTSLHEKAWEFMKAHPYNVGTSPWASSPPDMPDYCMVVP